MRKAFFGLLLGFLLIIGLPLLPWPWQTAQVHAQGSVLIVGTVLDGQNTPVEGATVELRAQSASKPLTEATTQADGSFNIEVPQNIPEGVDLFVDRAHFQEQTVTISVTQLRRLELGETVVLPQITLVRQINAAFWFATIIFVAMLALIAAGLVHNALAALLGTTLVFAVSYLGSAISPQLFIFTFEDAIRYIDWNVIFLIMGMMIVIAAVERTGLFQWLAFFAYRVSAGRNWLLVIVLMITTGVASAFLDNVTTMLLMAPITIQIALALRINPLSLLMPEIFASNVVGISTLIGTPTNILIGSFAAISFTDFLINLTPGVLMALVGLVTYSLLTYRRSLLSSTEVPPELLTRLEERAKITQPGNLRKAGIVGAGMLALFILGEHFHLVPSVTALMGATVLLLWVRPDIEEMIESVDWTTLVFFMALFIVVGSIREVGLISMIADLIGRLVGDNLIIAVVAIIWLSAILSTVVANIPFTAAMLPVVGFLSGTIPAAHSKVLFYCLSIGSAMGGNGSLIGASANMVASGIAQRAGYSVSYSYFLKKGFPALLVTVGLATIWIFIRFIFGR